MNPRLFLSFFVLLLVITAVSAALPASMTASGEKQGQIKGSATLTGKDGTMTVFAFQSNVTQMPSAAGPSLGIKKSAIVITKEFDKASPLLYNALNTNENLPEVKLRLYRPSGGGAGVEENYATLTLTDAKIAKIRAIKPLTLDPKTADYPDMEEVSFMYDSMALDADGAKIAGSNPGDAPFWITIEPKNITVSPGTSIKYKVTVYADPDFSDEITMTMIVNSMFIKNTFNLDNAKPPYPAVFEKEIMLPNEIPFTQKAKVTIRGESNNRTAEDTANMTVKASFNLVAFFKGLFGR